MSLRVECEYCKREVIKTQLKRHQLTKICIIAQGKNSSDALTPCPKCQKSLTLEGHVKHKCIDGRTTRKHKSSLQSLEKKIEELQEQVKVLSNTPKIVNNNIQIIICSDLFKNSVLTFKDLRQGGEAIAMVALDVVGNNILCLDINRLKFTYTGNKGQITDHGGVGLLTSICKGLVNQADISYNKAKDEYDPLTAVDMDFDILREGLYNLKSMKQGADGRIKNKLCQTIGETIGRYTVLNAPDIPPKPVSPEIVTNDIQSTNTTISSPDINKLESDIKVEGQESIDSDNDSTCSIYSYYYMSD